METQELRIGNWIMIDNELWQRVAGKVMIVTGTSDKCDHHFPNSNGIVSIQSENGIYSFSQYDQYIKPIPLTKEWLVKFGFKTTTTIFYLNDSGFTLNHQNGVFWLGQYSGTLAPLDYVHQLQNLYFALTNMELTLKK